MSNVTDYKIAVKYWDNGNHYNVNFLCSCGHFETYHRRSPIDSCPKCGNTRILWISSSNAPFLIKNNVLKTISKDDSGFHIARQEVIAEVDKENKKITFTKGSTGELKFSLKNKSFCVTKNGKEIAPNERNVDEFFKGTEFEDVINAIATECNKALYEFAYRELGAMNLEYSNKWYRGLNRLKQFPAVEIIGLSPLRSKLHSLWFNLPSLRFINEPTPLHKIIGLPKYMIPFLQHFSSASLNRRRLDSLKTLSDSFNGNTVRIMLQIFLEESEIYHLADMVDTLIELNKDYGYTDMKRLSLYLARDVKLQQGITKPGEAATILRDYVRMCTAMDIEYEKYPKSLKKEHDIALMNYEANKSKYKQNLFEKVVKAADYQGLSYKNKNYSIVIPERVSDIIKEGKSLSHCVASYVDDVINKKCKILFLRKTENLDKPLVTIEVRGNIIRQVRGEFNRRPYQEELDFINKWAKKKELAIALH